MRPVIAIPCDRRMLGQYPHQVVGEKYILGVTEGAGGMPWLVPALGEPAWLDDLLDRVDGVLLSGSPSNVEPHHYLGEPSRPGTLHDPERDATNLPLIPKLIERGIPLLGICRGFQEINVALGGELYQHVQEQPGKMDHRAPPDGTPEEQYAPAHQAEAVAGGWLAGLLGQERFMVNSVHQQGVKRLAPGLVAEARAEDGLVEAFRVEDAPAFAFAVQWHPEWRRTGNPVSMAILGAFGEACRARMLSRSA